MFPLSAVSTKTEKNLQIPSLSRLPGFFSIPKKDFHRRRIKKKKKRLDRLYVYGILYIDRGYGKSGRRRTQEEEKDEKRNRRSKNQKRSTEINALGGGGPQSRGWIYGMGEYRGLHDLEGAKMNPDKLDKT